MADNPSKQPQAGGPAAAPDQQQQQSIPARRRMSPGDQAPEGTPGTGQNVCGACGGTGIRNGDPCPACEGSGYVITGIGGA